MAGKCHNSVAAAGDSSGAVAGSACLHCLACSPGSLELQEGQGSQEIDSERDTSLPEFLRAFIDMTTAHSF